jgi:cadmium resistance protein CadD (predicted permease)
MDRFSGPSADLPSDRGLVRRNQETVSDEPAAYGHRIVPFVLIGLGIFILLESGTLALLGE